MYVYKQILENRLDNSTEFFSLGPKQSQCVVCLRMENVCLWVHWEGSRTPWTLSLMECHRRCCHGQELGLSKFMHCLTSVVIACA